MNILITGFRGFLGHNLSQFLISKNIRIYGLGRSKREIKNKNFIRGNINKKNLYKFKNDFDFIIHCAGSGRINYSYKKDYNNNVVSTKNILDLIKKKPTTKLIFISSISVFGNHYKKIANTSKKKPLSIYSKNKLKAEKLCEYYSKKNLLDILIFRIPSLYGIGLKKQLIYDTCVKMKKNKNIFFGSGKELRDWIHINDITRLIYMIIKKGYTGINYYNCSSKNQFTTKKIINYISKKMNKRLVPFFNYQKMNSNPEKMIFDKKSNKLVKWEPKINFFKSLDNYIKWFKKNSI